MRRFAAALTVLVLAGTLAYVRSTRGPSDVTEDDGIRLTLEVDRKSYRAGETIEARVRIQNTGRTSVWAQDSAPTDDPCLSPGVWVYADVPGLRAPGRTWPGTLGELKRATLKSAAIPDGTRAQRVPPRIPSAGFRLIERNRPNRNLMCNASSEAYEWSPGADHTIGLTWDGRVTDKRDRGFAVPSGQLTISAEWPRVDRSRPFPFRESPVVAQVEIDVRDGSDVVSGGEAIDEAFEDQRVRRWIEPRIASGLRGYLTYDHGVPPSFPAAATVGAIWRFVLTDDFVDAPRVRVHAAIDARNGKVHSVTYCPNPRIGLTSCGSFGLESGS